VTLAAQPYAAPGQSHAADAAAQTYDDPFAYCRAVGTIDAPDARWKGPAVPKSIAAGLAAAFDLPPGAPIAPFERGTSWRCMNGAVYACNVGANLPCSEKADPSRTPTSAMRDFCRDQPSSDFIPAYVTGRATVYEWRCRDGAPEAGRQIGAADARGYVADVWHELPAPPTASPH
jgi:hypothetical protein